MRGRHARQVAQLAREAQEAGVAGLLVDVLRGADWLLDESGRLWVMG